MPLAPVDRDGKVHLYYEDSGAPNNSDTYTTIVLLHGALFHGAVYRRLFPFAASNNIRFITANLRDYAGSTPFSLDELRAIGDASLEIQAHAIRERGHEVAFLLVHLIEKYNLPAISTAPGSDNRSGGLALLGWSLGACEVISFLAHADSLPDATKSLLELYLRTTVLYDPALIAVGDPPPQAALKGNCPPGLYNPFLDPTLSFEEIIARFPPSAATYYTPVPDLASVSEASLAPRVPLHEASDRTSSLDDLVKTPSTTRMSDEEFKNITDYSAINRLPQTIVKVDLKVFRENVRRALVARNGNQAEFVWKSNKVLVIWGDMTLSECILAAASLGKLAESDQAQRVVEIEKLEEANHFIHWDEPERFVKFLARHV